MRGKQRVMRSHRVAASPLDRLPDVVAPFAGTDCKAAES